MSKKEVKKETPKKVFTLRKGKYFDGDMNVGFTDTYSTFVINGKYVSKEVFMKWAKHFDKNLTVKG